MDILGVLVVDTFRSEVEFGDVPSLMILPFVALQQNRALATEREPEESRSGRSSWAVF
jgi:hypothetical protein